MNNITKVISQGPLLRTIESPEDLRKLEHHQLPQLSKELRAFIIDAVSINPGHFGASLGAVEMAIALHYSLNTPYDKLVWDVGHQAYAHKILTGRKSLFHLNRTYRGISGFPKMDESQYDAFGVGHSSTSISAVLGMAIAARLDGDINRQHVAVIGDGSMSAGMAFEAMNHAGWEKTNLLIILNDNGIAIDQNVGALKEYLTDITTSRTYNRFKNVIWKLLGGVSKYGPNTRRIVQQLQNAVKTSIFIRSNLFEALKFRYFGPVDGHDVIRLAKLITDLQQIPGPKLLHCITKKGKGYKYAEKDQTRFHSPGVFNKTTGESISENCDSYAPKYQHVFGKTMIELAKENEDIVGVTPAMPTGCSLNMMMEVMPHRVFDVGIAEQHAVTFSAGLAVAGKIPFCNIYSTFMQRAYDQVIHDVALQQLQVVFCLDRGGLVGEDGATHHGAFDLAFFRCIPNITIAAPMNEVELRNMMYSAQYRNTGTWAIRYPRGRGVIRKWHLPFEYLHPGKAQTIHEGNTLAFVTIGHAGNFVVKAREKLKEHNVDAAHFNMRFLKPLDNDLLHHIFKNYAIIITVEDGTIMGGLGSAVAEFKADNQYRSDVYRLGIPDRFVGQGSPEELFAECGYDTANIYRTAMQVLQKNPSLL
ncbi:MAG: 1-deoxy-D-xylulose-5-phosphate synthase [Bacteroidales bacterium]|nr:1-deoxy-D-xylulose-5-phosphate synthase [Bacteroidales bacterium]